MSKRRPRGRLPAPVTAICFAFIWANVAVAQTGFAAWGWGSNSELELDDWTAFARHVPVPMRDLREGVKQLSGGDRFTLALKNDGTVWAWGANDDGQVGNGRLNSTVESPVQVFSGARAVAAGGSHSLALKSDGTVWGWGNNVRAQLGIGTGQGNRTTAIQVRNLSDVVAVAAGAFHSMALKADGTVWCWGGNSTGQVGNGADGPDVLLPMQVPSLNNVIAIAAGERHSLALKADGTVWAWGDGSNGDLGDGDRQQRNAPVQVQGLTGVKAISAGGTHSLALKNDGTVWAWGYKLDGSTLDPNNFSTTPLQVPGLEQPVAIASGSLHNLVILRDGTVRAWGQNYAGELGNGSTMISRNPVTVHNLTKVVAVAAGESHSLALTSHPAPTPIDVCRLHNWACSPEPKLTPGHIGLQCDRPQCFIVDRVPKNCQSKYRCPGCIAGGLCPPVYQMTFEGLRDVWTIGLLHADGTAAPHDVVRTQNGVVLRFRPSKEKFDNGRIGDYVLIFQMSPKGIPGRKYDLKAGLKVDYGRLPRKHRKRF